MSFKRLLFVIPSYSHKTLDNFSKAKVVPYGVLSLVSYIECHIPDIKCKVFDMNIVQDKEGALIKLKHEILEFSPDAVGFSLMYNASLFFIDDYAKTIKEYNRDVFIFAGGIMATNLYGDIFEKSDLIDAVCHAEGEIPVRDLLESKDVKLFLRDHPSWLTNEDFRRGEKKPKAKFVENLDDIPEINYALVDLSKYTSRIYSDNEQFTLPVHSTRGCPFKCIFCCSASSHGRKIRYVSAEKFLKDVKSLITKYGVQKISIDDDQFLFLKDRAKKILKGLADFNIEIEMANGLSVKYIDDEIASLLKNAGLKIAVLAIESGSPRVLKNIINKPLRIEDIQPAVHALRRHGLEIRTFFMIGLPGETEEDRALTRDLMIKIGFDWNGIAIATPFRGSRLFTICEENNYFINKEYEDFNIYNCYIQAPGVDPKKITEAAYLLNLDVNFINNYNVRIENYSKATVAFRNVIERYPFHAIAYYCLAKVLEKTKNADKNEIHKLYTKYTDIIHGDIKWRKYADYFNIEISPQ